MMEIWDATITKQMVDDTTSVSRVAPWCQVEARNMVLHGVSVTGHSTHPVGEAICGRVDGRRFVDGWDGLWLDNGHDVM